VHLRISTTSAPLSSQTPYDFIPPALPNTEIYILPYTTLFRSRHERAGMALATSGGASSPAEPSTGLVGPVFPVTPASVPCRWNGGVVWRSRRASKQLNGSANDLAALTVSGGRQ